MEHNAAPERLDLNDHDLRLAKELGCKIVISSDSHDSRNLGKMGYGVKQLRRAWLEPGDVLNTREAEDFLAGLENQAVAVAGKQADPVERHGGDICRNNLGIMASCAWLEIR